MTKHTYQPAPETEEVTLKEVIQKVRSCYWYLIQRWQLILFVSLLGGLAGFCYAYLKDPLYKAECTFVLEESGGNDGLSQYSGMAAILGVDLGGAGGNSLFSGNNIYELYKSRLMIEKTLLTRVNIKGQQQLLIDRYIAVLNLRKEWEDNPKLKNITFMDNTHKLSVNQSSAIGQIVNRINTRYLKIEKKDPQASIISVKVVFPDAYFSKLFNDELVRNVNSFYVQTKTKRSSQNLGILLRQQDSIKRVLNRSMNSAASAVDANPNPNEALQILRVPSQRRQIDVQASASFYNEIVRNIALARVSLSKETPLIQVIDSPQFPLDLQKPNSTKFTLIFLLLFFILINVLLILIKIVQDNS